MPPTLLFGPFDRHNLGDLLFPHVVAALLDELGVDDAPAFAGLAARDLGGAGGHATRALHDPATAALRATTLLHCGGEILTCTARQAAAMLLEPRELDATLAFVDAHPAADASWRGAVLGTTAAMPYVATRADVPGIARVVFAGVGGVALDALDEDDRAAVLARLADADIVAVRDAVTLGHLRAAGIAASLVADPVVLVEALFGDAIRARVTHAPVAAVRTAFPGGYLAVQVPAGVGDDAMLATLSGLLERVAVDTGLGIVLFAAGTAPWHDDARVLARLASRLPPRHVRLFEAADADLWDTCALLAHARVVAATSLHACVVANAFAVPAVGLELAGHSGQGAKLAAVAQAWLAGDTAVVRHLDDLPTRIADALDADPSPRRARARDRIARADEGWGQVLHRCKTSYLPETSLEVDSRASGEAGQG